MGGAASLRMTKSIAEAVWDVADYVETKMGLGAFDIMPGIHERSDRRREADAQAEHKIAADALRAFAKRSESEPVTLVGFVLLLEALPVPDIVRKPAEWAIYDKYG